MSDEILISKKESYEIENRTIMLIHGLWMTPLCWENFKERFEGLGYNVLTPAWPGHDGDVEDVR